MPHSKKKKEKKEKKEENIIVQLLLYSIWCKKLKTYASHSVQ